MVWYFGTGTTLRLLRLDLIGVQEIRWDKCGCEPADDYIFFYGNGIANYYIWTGFFMNIGIITVVKRVEFVPDRMLHII
jgi:hypothetical protein